MLRALLPLLLTCGISAAAQPSPAGAAPKNVPISRPQAQPAPASAAPAKDAASTQLAVAANTLANAPAKSAKPAKTDQAHEGLRSDSYRALISLIVMGTIALRHVRTGTP